MSIDRREYNRQYQKTHAKEHTERQLRYLSRQREADPDGFLKKLREQYKRHPEKKRARNRRWALANKETVREYKRKWNLKHRDKRLAYMREWYRKRRVERATYMREWKRKKINSKEGGDMKKREKESKPKSSRDVLFADVIAEIKKIKIRHDVSNEVLAVKIGISVYTLWRMLHEYVRVPHRGTFLLLQNFIKAYNEDRNFLSR